MIKLNSIFTILVIAFIFQNASSTQSLTRHFMLSGLLSTMNFYEEEVRSRLENMDCLVTAKIDDDVLSQVKRFVSRDKSSTLEILKRTQIYFPLIDKIFTEYNLPVELKYITIVESSLLLDVKSNVGAAGIWQFMPATARLLKLTVNEKLDQRLDPVLSTHAAARYFRILYEMFGDWSLAISAYNCGEYKIKEILENTNGKDYWGIKRYLPRQTQLFVPAFIGASYMMQYYVEHNISTELELLDNEKITFVKIHKEVNLKDLFKKTSIDREVFTSLNPSYKKGMIPSLHSGSYVSLPDSLMVEFVDYYMFKNKKNQIINRVQIELDAESISDHEIISFNRPFIFAPDNIFVKQSNDVQLEIDLHQIQNTTDLPKINSTNEFEFEYHIVKSRESISEIAENYRVNIEDLISWNEIDSNQQLRTGTVIRIKN
jgi:membrane-bound lytic murein transglycosylase D